jgi:hypothetical protein
VKSTTSTTKDYFVDSVLVITQRGKGLRSAKSAILMAGSSRLCIRACIMPFIEPELLPCLRKYQIAFYTFNPLAGGYLTSRNTRDMLLKDDEIEKGSRFDPQKRQGQDYRRKYWNEK